ncbi:hypothetical protein HDV00_002227 [Rhizophlyctis rosea]|nr:hypothetical protein HDV00_002227 [Rhizophlyctis rosea]
MTDVDYISDQATYGSLESAHFLSSSDSEMEDNEAAYGSLESVNFASSSDSEMEDNEPGTPQSPTLTPPSALASAPALTLAPSYAPTEDSSVSGSQAESQPTQPNFLDFEGSYLADGMIQFERTPSTLSAFDKYLNSQPQEQQVLSQSSQATDFDMADEVALTVTPVVNDEVDPQVRPSKKARFEQEMKNRVPQLEKRGTL